jgi:hypothetical protein
MMQRCEVLAGRRHQGCGSIPSAWPRRIAPRTGVATAAGCGPGAAKLAAETQNAAAEAAPSRNFFIE